MCAQPHTPLTTSRLESFSDGVIAVIITIMVLDLKIPPQNGIAGLHTLLPVLLVYALSFVFTGIYWVNHHILLHRTTTVGPRILYANLLFLFALSLLPFFTSWLVQKNRTAVSVQLYISSLAVIGFSFFLLRLAVDHRLRLAQEHHPSDRFADRKHLASLALYLVTIPLARFAPTAALLTNAALTISWILPSLGTRRSPESP